MNAGHKQFQKDSERSMSPLKSKQYFEKRSESTTSMVTAWNNIHTLEAFQILQNNYVINSVEVAHLVSFTNILQ